MMYRSAVWTNGKRTQTGRWLYLRSRDEFHIVLDSRDSVTGRQRELTTSNDSPEWGNWKLQR